MDRAKPGWLKRSLAPKKYSALLKYLKEAAGALPLLAVGIYCLVTGNQSFWILLAMAGVGLLVSLWMLPSIIRTEKRLNDRKKARLSLLSEVTLSELERECEQQTPYYHTFLLTRDYLIALDDGLLVPYITLKAIGPANGKSRRGRVPIYVQETDGFLQEVHVWDYAQFLQEGTAFADVLDEHRRASIKAHQGGTPWN